MGMLGEILTGILGFEGGITRRLKILLHTL